MRAIRNVLLGLGFVATLAAAQAARAESIPPPVAFYSLNGNVIDSVSDVAATVVGSVKYSPGVPGLGGEAFNFDGGTEIVSALTASDLGISGNASRTVAGWFETDVVRWLLGRIRGRH